MKYVLIAAFLFGALTACGDDDPIEIKQQPGPACTYAGDCETFTPEPYQETP